MKSSLWLTNPVPQDSPLEREGTGFMGWLLATWIPVLPGLFYISRQTASLLIHCRISGLMLSSLPDNLRSTHPPWEPTIHLDAVFPEASQWDTFTSTRFSGPSLCIENNPHRQVASTNIHCFLTACSCVSHLFQCGKSKGEHQSCKQKWECAGPLCSTPWGIITQTASRILPIKISPRDS